MNIALDTNAYSDFMRGDGERVQIVRAARSIVMPIIVLGELRTGFAASDRESANAANLQRFLASPRVSALLPDEQTTHHYAQLHLQLRNKGARIPTNDLWDRRHGSPARFGPVLSTATSGSCRKSSRAYPARETPRAHRMHSDWIRRLPATAFPDANRD